MLQRMYVVMVLIVGTTILPAQAKDTDYSIVHGSKACDFLVANHSNVLLSQADRIFNHYKNHNIRMQIGMVFEGDLLPSDTVGDYKIGVAICALPEFSKKFNKERMPEEIKAKGSADLISEVKVSYQKVGLTECSIRRVAKNTHSLDGILDFQLFRNNYFFLKDPSIRSSNLVFNCK